MKLCLDLVQDWLVENAYSSIIGPDLIIHRIATYQPSDGLMDLKVVNVLIPCCV